MITLPATFKFFYYHHLKVPICIPTPMRMPTKLVYLLEYAVHKCNNGQHLKVPTIKCKQSCIECEMLLLNWHKNKNIRATKSRCCAIGYHQVKREKLIRAMFNN